MKNVYCSTQSSRSNWAKAAALLLGLAVCLGWTALQATAQTGGTGSIQGVVTDPSGSVVAGASITATNTLTGTKTEAVSTKTGHYVLPLLQPGPYTVTVKAATFQSLTQTNIIVDALATVSVEPKLTIGSADQSITVTDAPTMLATDDVKLGSNVENDTYDALPLAMNNSARDPSAFGQLAVGVNSFSVQAAGPSTGSYNGGQTYQNETYVEGLPMTSAGTESDTRNLAFGTSVEAVEQFQVAVTGSEATYEGQGVSNFILKSGTSKFHGGVNEYFRNTIFDAKPFFAASVPIEHQNEYGGSVGGPIIKDKLFFFANYDGYRFDSAIPPSYQTIPTTAAQSGDFSAYTGFPIFDPTTCVTKNAGGSCTGRTQFSYNGVLNVIPPGRLSAVAKSFQSYLPPPTTTGISSNYLASLPNRVNNDSVSSKVDYTINEKHHLYGILSKGKYANPVVGSLSAATATTNSTLPTPYTDGRSVIEYATLAQIHEAYAINATTVNDFGFGVNRLWIPLTSNTAGGNYPTKAGLTGLPAGIASTGFPDISFSGNDVPVSWDGTNSHAFNEAQTTFTAQDNLLWTKGKHHFTFGFQWQALQDNYNNPLSGTQAGFSFANGETANFCGTSTTAVCTAKGASSATLDTTNNGLPYASFLLGMVDSSVVVQNAVAETGGRYKTSAPYIQDNIQVSQKLTVNLGLRWDVWSPYTEANNHMTFFDPNAVNPVAGNIKGALSFAGRGAAPYCNCNTPVQYHYKNFGPRIGIAYRLTNNDVIRGSYGIFYAHAGGVGGRTNGRQGLGDIGYNNSGSLSSVATGQGAYYNAASTSSTNGSWDNGYPGNPINPPFINPSYGIGFITATAPGAAAIGAGPATAQTLAFGDPLKGGQPPQYQNWSLNLQHSFSPNMTLSVAYSASVGHHLPGAGVAGPMTNQIPTQYLPLGSLLTQAWTPALAAQAQAIFPGISLAAPFPNFAPTATLAQALKPFPQYSGLSDPWLDVGNSAYHSLQTSFNRRMANGLTFMANYTFSKEQDDLNSNPRFPGMDFLEWSVGGIDHTHVATGTFVYKLPFGLGHRISSDNLLVRNAIGGWQFSGIVQEASGAPLSIAPASSGCTGYGIINASCYPNYTAVGSTGVNGSSWTGGSVWQNGRPSTATAAKTTVFLNAAAFSLAPAGTYGNVARNAPLSLFAPRTADTDLSLRKEIALPRSMTFSLQADAFNLTNSVYFSAPNVTLPNSPAAAVTSSFGTFSSQANQARKWQFSGRINF